MLAAEYATLRRHEDTHWWYAGLAGLVVAALRQRGDPARLRLLDAGCGTGGLLGRVDGALACGVDVAPLALAACRERGLRRVAGASVERLPFRDEAFDAVVSLDVLYHAWVDDDLAALREFHRVLGAGGLLILNLPAYPRLQSSHDRAIMTRRRYTRKGLGRQLGAAGFATERLTYRNACLFPVAALLRLWRRRRPAGDPSDLVAPPRTVNRALAAVLSLENRWLGHASLPFGLSVFAVARKG